MHSVQFNRSVASDSLRPHGLQHPRHPCPSPTPRAYSNPSLESVMSSNHLILYRPLLPPSIFPSIRVFSNESVLRIRWPKYWSFNFSISPSCDYSGLISFRIDWFDHAVQGTLSLSWLTTLNLFLGTQGRFLGGWMKPSSNKQVMEGPRKAFGSCRVLSVCVSRSVMSHSLWPHGL